MIWHTIGELPTDFQTATGLIREHLRLPKESEEETIWRALDSKAVLIVLDSAELCKDPAAYITRINGLNVAGGTRFLMTSREEWVETKNRKRYSPAVLKSGDAIKILRAMVDAEQPSFTLNGEASDVAKAARYHPRLMQYAVYWLNDRSPAGVIDLLTTLKGAGPDEAMADLLGQTIAQIQSKPDGINALATLRKLIVFRGGATEDAIKAILGNDMFNSSALSILRRWGLLTVDRGRYIIDPLVIDYVRLTPTLGEAVDAIRAHFDYYKALAELHDKKQDYLGLDPESENLSIAFERAMTTDRAEDAFRLAEACRPFLTNRGRFVQSMDWFTRVSAALQNTADEGLRAFVQNSLGVIYITHPLGDRRSNWQKSITALTEALRFRTPATAPLAYAMTQNNLGAAYSDLATLEDREGNLRRSIAAYSEALHFFKPEIVPLDYAMTQNNLGNTYRDLAALENGTDNLHRAIVAYSEAHRFWTPDAAPLYYAMTQNNLGVTFSDLAAIEDRAINLSRSIAAYTEALRFLTAEAAALDYAATQANLGLAYRDFDQLAKAVECWREAEHYYRLMNVIEEADKMHLWIVDAERQLSTSVK